MIHLTLEELLARAESGATEPYLCRLSDGQLYYVKGRSATVRGLIAEALCAVVGREFDLPVPEFALVEIHPRMTEHDANAQRSLGSGIAFASLKRDTIYPVTTSSLGIVPAGLQRRLFAFDYWIRNEDRTGTEHGGNPNFFLSGPNHAPVVIDHNLAFDPAFDLEKNRLYHVCREAWNEAKGDLLLPSQLRDTMLSLLDHADRAVERLPEEWLEMAPNAASEMIERLHACDTDEFWDALNG